MVLNKKKSQRFSLWCRCCCRYSYDSKVESPCVCCNVVHVSKGLSILAVIVILTGGEHVEVILGLADNDGVSGVVATLFSA